MGANAQTSVPTFTAGEVLTAADMNISARTGIPVFATTVERDAAFGGTGEKTLAEGQFAYIENIAGSAATQYYDGAVWQTLVTGGLTLISATTIGTAVSSVAVSDVFSATYDNYRITVTGGVASTTNELFLQLGATTTGYYSGVVRITYSGGVVGGTNTNNGANWNNIGTGSTGTLDLLTELRNPFASKITTFSNQNAQTITAGQAYMSTGFQNSTTSFTGFTILVSTGTITGGTIRVYGYANS